jgi:hypothetical protein
MITTVNPSGKPGEAQGKLSWTKRLSWRRDLALTASFAWPPRCGDDEPAGYRFMER